MKQVRLKNGSVVPHTLVKTTMTLIIDLFHGKAPGVKTVDGTLAVIELHSKAKDPNHEYFDGTKEILQKFSLLDSRGNIHGIVRDIVLSAVSGDGIDMKLDDPIAQLPSTSLTDASVEPGIEKNNQIAK